MNHLDVALLLIVLHMGTKSIDASPSLFETQDKDEDAMATQIVNGKDYLPYTFPDSCQAGSEMYCFDKGDKYPDKLIAELLENMPELPVVNPERTTELFQCEERHGNTPKDNADCPANTTYVNKPIYYIFDTNDEVRVVVQSPKFQQLFSVKWCLKPGRITEDTEHFVKDSNVLKNFEVECVNTYMDFEFYVLSHDFGPKLEIVKIHEKGIPVCCRCRYSQIAK